jgi:hypothetical protein
MGDEERRDHFRELDDFQAMAQEQLGIIGVRVLPGQLEEEEDPEVEVVIVRLLGDTDHRIPFVWFHVNSGDGESLMIVRVRLDELASQLARLHENTAAHDSELEL